jgi:hypothetical protein
VYQSEFDNYDDLEYPHDDIYDSGYKAYHIDGYISEILVSNTNTNCFGTNGKSNKVQAILLPRDKWIKLT